MRLVSWNMRRATMENASVWEYFSSFDPDLALLQEVNSIPEAVTAGYRTLFRVATGKTGGRQPFGTAILARASELNKLILDTDWAWVNQELRRFQGYFVTAMVELNVGLRLHVMSVHSPAWPIDRDRLKDIDTQGVRLTENPDVWGTELVWAMLRRQDLQTNDWVVGGDFNSSETFDTMWSGGPRGNGEFLERMRTLGLTEALRHMQGKLTPTFRNSCGGRVIHQLDHVFVGTRILENLVECYVGDHERVFGQSLSDHLPVIAEINTEAMTT